MVYCRRTGWTQRSRRLPLELLRNRTRQKSRMVRPHPAWTSTSTSRSRYAHHIWRLITDLFIWQLLDRITVFHKEISNWCMYSNNYSICDNIETIIVRGGNWLMLWAPGVTWDRGASLTRFCTGGMTDWEIKDQRPAVSRRFENGVAAHSNYGAGSGPAFL